MKFESDRVTRVSATLKSLFVVYSGTYSVQRQKLKWVSVALVFPKLSIWSCYLRSHSSLTGLSSSSWNFLNFKDRFLWSLIVINLVSRYCAKYKTSFRAHKLYCGEKFTVHKRQDLIETTINWKPSSKVHLIHHWINLPPFFTISNKQWSWGNTCKVKYVPVNTRMGQNLRLSRKISLMCLHSVCLVHRSKVYIN